MSEKVAAVFYGCGNDRQGVAEKHKVEQTYLT